MNTRLVGVFRSFYNVYRAKSFTLREKIQRFVAADRSKIISLQDIPRVGTVTLRDRKILQLRT